VNDQIPLVDLRAQYAPIKDKIRQSWDEILDSMNLFLGPNVQAFEKEFAEYCGVTDAIGVSDGTTALQLALMAVGIGPGDEVITVSNTFIATLEAILLVGAEPVFVDIDPYTHLMDVNQIESRLSAKTRAIMPVHLYGQCVDMDPVLEIAGRYNLYVIEDACQAHGAEYKGKKAGSIGHLAAFSFYFSKNLGAYGEGGMVTTREPALAEQVRALRNHGSKQRYYHEQVGLNGRLDELQAAVLRIKLQHLDDWNTRRREIAHIYNGALANVDVVTPLEGEGNRHIYHLYVIQTHQRDALYQHLNQRGIGAGIHYPVPIHLQDVCNKIGFKQGSLPVTESVTSKILSLPIYAELREDQIDRIVKEVHQFLSIKEPV
jgi:dTDP-4-amino-4,6-dideoxygalactose transaminase